MCEVTVQRDTAALCIPIISVAYQVLTLAMDEETRRKMATTITLGGMDLLQYSGRGSCGNTHLQREGQYLYINKGFNTPE